MQNFCSLALRPKLCFSVLLLILSQLPFAAFSSELLNERLLFSMRWQKELEAREDADFIEKTSNPSYLRSFFLAGVRARRIDDGLLIPNRFGLIGRMRYSSIADAPYSGLAARPEFDLRELSAAWLWQKSALSIGIQEVVWGETIGIPILDLVHARDQREPIYNDFRDLRIPDAMLRLDFELLESLGLQLLLIPFPSEPQIPKTLESQPVARSTDHKDLFLPEYGARLGWLMESGLNLSGYFLHHPSRWPVYQPILADGEALLVFQTPRMDSVGFSFSQSLRDFVVRGDAVAHMGHVVYNPDHQRSQKGSFYRSALGIDWISGENSLLALQVSQDEYGADFESYLNKRTYSWVALKIAKSTLERKLQLEILAMNGLSHKDFWLQPRLIMKYGEGVTLDLRFDLLDGSTDLGSYFGRYREKDRFRLSLKYQL